MLHVSSNMCYAHLKTESWQGCVSAHILRDRDGDGGLVEHRQLVIDVSHLEEEDVVKMIINCPDNIYLPPGSHWSWSPLQTDQAQSLL